MWVGCEGVYGVWCVCVMCVYGVCGVCVGVYGVWCACVWVCVYMCVQLDFMVGRWNLPSYGSSPRYALSGANTQIGDYSTYYTPLCILHPPCRFLQTHFR